MAKPDSPYPFYFALPNWASSETRAKAPSHIEANFGVRGRIEHVSTELAFRLYRIVEG